MLEVQPPFAALRLRQMDDSMSCIGKNLFETRLGILSVPRPAIPEPDCGEQADSRRFWSTIADSYANENVIRSALRVLDNYIEISVLIEYPGIQQLELGLVFSALS